MPDTQLNFLTTVAQTIYDKKGMNILALDVRGVSTLTDYVLVAEGSVDRHVIAIAHAVIDALKKEGERPFQVEGLETGDWVVIDYLQYMVHIFMPGLREKYRLEELFRDGKIIDLQIKT
ncbi:MAG: ribosome silencing factor [Verrucomicrobia bacterium]|nr:ribosome silencing factor [Verrucomicrobiota bacterium]